MTSYDDWKTDPEYGLTHRDLREAELKTEAEYDLETLPMRQKTLRAMSRDPHRGYDSLQIIAREYERNYRRIKAAKALLEKQVS